MTARKGLPGATIIRDHDGNLPPALGGSVDVVARLGDQSWKVA